MRKMCHILFEWPSTAVFCAVGSFESCDFKSVIDGNNTCVNQQQQSAMAILKTTGPVFQLSLTELI